MFLLNHFEVLDRLVTNGRIDELDTYYAFVEDMELVFMLDDLRDEVARWYPGVVRKRPAARVVRPQGTGRSVPSLSLTASKVRGGGEDLRREQVIDAPQRSYRGADAVRSCLWEDRLDTMVRAADGRTLAVREAGDPNGLPVLVHHGTPGSRRLYRRTVADAAAQGLRLICYDRPGYGGSDAAPGRTVADCAADVRAICQALGIGRLAMWGGSGGGPHVLACAALLPDLVTAAAALASLAPYDAPGLDWFAGMGRDNVDDFRALLTDDHLAVARFDRHRAECLAATPDSIAATMRDFLTSTPDAEVLTGELAEDAVHDYQISLASGSQGWHDDNQAHLSPWGFDLAAIRVPVLLLHGGLDKFVPFAHGQWLATHIPGAQPRLLDHDGHLTITARYIHDVHTWLTDQSTLAPGPR